ncbi:MAG: hypothetical protein RTU92_14445 [Candidatus Thorarchaeota archaeon]
MPEGDKAIQNCGLSCSIKLETLEYKIEYPREVAAEDGCFSGGRYSITRHHVVHAGKKTDTNSESLTTQEIRQELIDFVLSKGKKKPADLSYKYGERVEISVAQLKLHVDSSNEMIATRANDLITIAYDNRNRLLDDEVNEIFHPLGIKMRTKPKSFIFYVESGRLSVRWASRTKTKDDAMRWSLLSPPNHNRKMAEVVNFVRSNPKRAARIKIEIEKEGLVIHPEWRKYGI